MKVNKGIETNVSETAKNVCFCRALSHYEKNKYFKSDDYLAPVIIDAAVNSKLKKQIFRTFVKMLLRSGSIYEYIIARTKLIDNLFENLSDDIQQVLIFGAGFDSRAVRFKSILNKAKVFEFDSPVTQRRKIARFKEVNIELPSNLKFIPVNLNEKSLSQKLDEAGFQKNKKSLHVLEGLTMYLDQEAIDNVFNLINTYSAKGSIVVFDYIYASVLRQENTCYGEKTILKSVARQGARFNFGIEKGRIREFLAKYNFELINEFDADELQKKYFTDENGKRISRVNGAQCIVTAKKI